MPMMAVATAECVSPFVDIDHGVLALLDTRIQRMPYGKIFLESLPRYRRTGDLGEVSRFLSEASPA